MSISPRVDVVDQIDQIMSLSKGYGERLVAIEKELLQEWEGLVFEAGSVSEEFQTSGLAWLYKAVGGESGLSPDGFDRKDRLWGVCGMFNQTRKDALNYLPFRPFSQWKPERFEQYLQHFGAKEGRAEIERKFRSSEFSKWFESEFPRRFGEDLDAGRYPKGLSEYAAQQLAKDLLGNERTSDYAERLVQRLVVGARESRWELPVVEGLLTAEYWEQVVANDFAEPPALTEARQWKAAKAANSEGFDVPERVAGFRMPSAEAVATAKAILGNTRIKLDLMPDTSETDKPAEGNDPTPE